MIENIATTPPIFEYDEREYLNAEILKIAKFLDMLLVLLPTCVDLNIYRIHGEKILIKK